MSNMTNSESLLRSWKPRHPSRRLKSRIFAEAETDLPVLASAPGVGATLEMTPFRLGWLAPVMVSLLLGCVLFNHHNAVVLGQAPAAGTLVAAAVSNQHAAAWLPGSFQACHNSLPVDVFEYTHSGSWASNASSSSRSKGSN